MPAAEKKTLEKACVSASASAVPVETTDATAKAGTTKARPGRCGFGSWPKSADQSRCRPPQICWMSTVTQLPVPPIPDLLRWRTAVCSGGHTMENILELSLESTQQPCATGAASGYPLFRLLALPHDRGIICVSCTGQAGQKNLAANRTCSSKATLNCLL